MMKIFAYVDRSPFAESVWQHAVWVAKQLDFPIEIIHVLDQPASTPSRDYSGYHRFDNQQSAMEERIRLDELQNRVLIAEGRQLLDAIAESVREAGITRVSQRLYQGTLAEHLQQNASDCLVAVVGKRGEGAGQDSRHLGRNIERVVRSAHRPVLVVAKEFTPIKQAVVAWDTGKSSGETIHFLAKHPLLHGIPTALVHVSDNAEKLPAAIRDAQQHLETSGMDVIVSGRSGPVADAILQAVDDAPAQLLVAGAYGHSRIRNLVIGSTTTEMLMRSRVSVLVFHKYA